MYFVVILHLLQFTDFVSSYLRADQLFVPLLRYCVLIIIRERILNILLYFIIVSY